MTYVRIIDSLETGTTNASRRIQSLGRNGYEQDDLGAVARDVAALWERSLKASDSSWSEKSLFQITRTLETAGWATAAPALDTIRLAANSDKHDSNRSHDFDRILDAVTILQTELGSLSVFAAGIVTALPPSLRVRRLVCAVYEVFHAGETLYSFLAADGKDSWRTAEGLDEFQVENKHTSTIEDQLAQLPAYQVNPAELDQLKLSLLESDSELWQIMRLDASYQQVHDILAQYQHGLPLLTGLHREDCNHNFIASVARSVLAGEPPLLSARSPLDYAQVRAAVESIIDRVPDRLKPLRLDRCSASEFASQSQDAVVVDRSIGALVTNRGVLFLRAD